MEVNKKTSSVFLTVGGGRTGFINGDRMEDGLKLGTDMREDPTRSRAAQGGNVGNSMGSDGGIKTSYIKLCLMSS